MIELEYMKIRLVHLLQWQTVDHFVQLTLVAHFVILNTGKCFVCIHFQWSKQSDWSIEIPTLHRTRELLRCSKFRS